MTRFGLLVVLTLATGLPFTSQAPAFEVASVKRNTSGDQPSSRFPLGPGDAYVNGSLFSATNQPLINYIRFAFKRSQGELLRLPSWFYDERFDIQARAAGEPTKDDMRLMMGALLAARFNLAWHVEQREESVLELVLTKPGELGPQLTRHATGQPCGLEATLPPDPHLPRFLAALAWCPRRARAARESRAARNPSRSLPGCCPTIALRKWIVSSPTEPG